MPAGESVRSIKTLQDLPFYAKIVLVVAVSLMGIALVQPVSSSLMIMQPKPAADASCQTVLCRAGFSMMHGNSGVMHSRLIARPAW